MYLPQKKIKNFINNKYKIILKVKLILKIIKRNTNKLVDQTIQSEIVLARLAKHYCQTCRVVEYIARDYYLSIRIAIKGLKAKKVVYYIV